jgi:hypothetical protein
MATDQQPAGSSREELIVLADALLAEAGEVRRQWGDLHRALRGDAPEEAPKEAKRRGMRREEADTDPRRLVAVEMMLAGRSREEIERHLHREFGAAAAAEVLAQVYADGA